MRHAGFNGSDAGRMEGRYVNYFEIGHNACEFVLDFGQLFSEDAEAGLHTRLVTNPEAARELAAVLNDALRQYERRYGGLPDRDGTGGDCGQAIERKKGRTAKLKIV